MRIASCGMRKGQGLPEASRSPPDPLEPRCSRTHGASARLSSPNTGLRSASVGEHVRREQVELAEGAKSNKVHAPPANNMADARESTKKSPCFSKWRTSDRRRPRWNRNANRDRPGHSPGSSRKVGARKIDLTSEPRRTATSIAGSRFRPVPRRTTATGAARSRTARQHLEGQGSKTARSGRTRSRSAMPRQRPDRRSPFGPQRVHELCSEPKPSAAPGGGGSRQLGLLGVDPPAGGAAPGRRSRSVGGSGDRPSQASLPRCRRKVHVYRRAASSASRMRRFVSPDRNDLGLVAVRLGAQQLQESAVMPGIPIQQHHVGITALPRPWPRPVGGLGHSKKASGCGPTLADHATVVDTRQVFTRGVRADPYLAPRGYAR